MSTMEVGTVEILTYPRRDGTNLGRGISRGHIEDTSYHMALSVFPATLNSFELDPVFSLPMAMIYLMRDQYGNPQPDQPSNYFLAFTHEVVDCCFRDFGNPWLYGYRLNPADQMYPVVSDFPDNALPSSPALSPTVSSQASTEDDSDRAATPEPSDSNSGFFSRLSPEIRFMVYEWFVHIVCNMPRKDIVQTIYVDNKKTMVSRVNKQKRDKNTYVILPYYEDIKVAPLVFRPNVRCEVPTEIKNLLATCQKIFGEMLGLRVIQKYKRYVLNLYHGFGPVTREVENIVMAPLKTLDFRDLHYLDLEIKLDKRSTPNRVRERLQGAFETLAWGARLYKLHIRIKEPPRGLDLNFFKQIKVKQLVFVRPELAASSARACSHSLSFEWTRPRDDVGWSQPLTQEALVKIEEDLKDKFWVSWREKLA